MTHPEELLAPYVDGTASSEERAAVDAHVLSCARCRAEIGTATAARSALKRLPVVEAPSGLAPEVGDVSPLEERSGGAPGWYRWAGVASVAALIVLLLAMVLPHLGKGPAGKSDLGASANSGFKTSQVRIEIQTQDYSGTTALSDLLKVQAGVVASPQVSVGTAPVAAETSPQTGTPTQTKDAQACIKTAFKKVPGSLTRLISASFAGAPAYIGIYEQGPVGQSPDTLVARAASVSSCTILSFATARLTP